MNNFQSVINEKLKEYGTFYGFRTFRGDFKADYLVKMYHTLNTANYSKSASIRHEPVGVSNETYDVFYCSAADFKVEPSGGDMVLRLAHENNVLKKPFVVISFFEVNTVERIEIDGNTMFYILYCNKQEVAPIAS
ncbi:MAG TPA: hypothetical protein P5539_14430 [Mesotoga sp.]|nr:hypothetical protein [Mesotoga sp.]